MFLNINTSNRSTRGLSGVVGQGHLFEVVHNITGNEQRPFSAPDLQSLAPGVFRIIFKGGCSHVWVTSGVRRNALRPIIHTRDRGMDETSTASIFASSTSRVLLSLLSLKYMGSREDEHILALEIRCQCRFQRLPQIFDFRLAQFHFLVLNRHPIGKHLFKLCCVWQLTWVENLGGNSIG